MTKDEIFKSLINILSPEDVRSYMEYNIDISNRIIYPQVEALGLKVLGMGMYALVVEHENYPGRAFKVTTSLLDGFRTYAKYCKENEGVPYLPVIHSINEQDNFGCYELDKYYPIVKPCNGYETFVSIKCEDMYTYAHAGQYASTEGILQGTPEQLAIYTLAKNIANEFGKRFTTDIHTGNIMVDSNGNVIITDPLGGDLNHEIPDTEDIQKHIGGLMR